MTEYIFEYIREKQEKEYFKKLEKDYRRNAPLRVEIIENGVILPRKDVSGTALSYAWMGIGGVLDSNDNFVELSGIPGFRANEGKMVFGGKYEYDNAEFLDEEILYMGVYQPHWGHFLLEYCTRLWYYIKFNPNIRIAYCGFNCEPQGMNGNFMDFLKLLGVKEEQLIDIRKPTKVRKIIIPEQSFLRDKYFTDEYKMMIDYAYQNIDKTNMQSYEKVYFTRVEFASEKERGEKEIKEILEMNGYVCLAPEQMSVSEQMFYVRNCKEFVAVIGGASMNGVFAEDKTKRIYLKKAYLTEWPGDVFQIDQMTHASKVIILDCYFRPYKSLPIKYGGGPHFIGVTKEVRLFLKTNYMKSLGKKEIYAAIIKNWIWQTKKFKEYKHNQRKDKLVFNKIRAKIYNLINRGQRKFIIYPYGKIGNMAKNILDQKNITSYILADHYKCSADKAIHDIDVLYDNHYRDYKILLLSDPMSAHYESIKAVVSKVEDKERIVELI